MRPVILHTLLPKMAAVLHHRGPDARGIWINSEGRLGFAHTRLSILDLSDDGNQPMHQFLWSDTV